MGPDKLSEAGHPPPKEDSSTFSKLFPGIGVWPAPARREELPQYTLGGSSFGKSKYNSERPCELAEDKNTASSRIFRCFRFCFLEQVDQCELVSKNSPELY